MDGVLKVVVNGELGKDIHACQGSYRGLHHTKTAKEKAFPTLESLMADENVTIHPWKGL